ncbi:glycosyltransferase family 4 protein [Sporichthya polymorpha]|uniref:glycosyltransferase family 4 protein n=1 Tax=Sporichthya polymorpha TaxID=35751 RepID=UPI00036EBD1B|nr:glycosyltransferase family 4 protein [Sporichthya polymorpha]
MTAPRVLLVLAGSTGGIGRHVLSVVEGLVAAGIPVAVAGPEQGDLDFGFSRAGAVFHVVEIGGAPSPRDVAAVRALTGAITSWRPTVVHAHGLRAAGVAIAARAATRARGRTAGARPRPGLVVTWHNVPVVAGARRALQHGLETVAARGADLTLGASEDLVARARRFGARHARLGPVAAPPLPPPAREPAEVRAELGATDRPLLLAVGRLAPQKDYPTMLAAARRWAEEDPAPVLVIAGDGPLADDLAAQIARDRLDVRLLGARSDVADLLGAADAVVLSSTWEARALVAQEALRAGVPLVATAVGGVPGLVGDAALLVPPGDPAALAGAVRRVLTEPGLAAELAAAGRRRSAAWPDETAVQSELITLYREWRDGALPPIP